MTAGAGHRRAAEALAQALQHRYPDADVRCVDVLAYASGTFHQFYAMSYLLLVRYCSWVWRISYALLDRPVVYRMVQPLRRRWNLWIARRFVAMLRQRPPDVTVATHFLPADVCSDGRKRGWLPTPLVVVITDFYPHRFWTTTDADAVVAGTEQSAELLAQRGVPRTCIRVLGIPIRQKDR